MNAPTLRSPFSQLQLDHHALGAQIAHAGSPELGELFYVTPTPVAGQPLRGGVPLLFPQFNDRGPLKKHGFVRGLPWTLQTQAGTADLATACYGLQLSEPTWPHHAQLTFTATLTASCLTLAIDVLNTGDTAFSFTGGLHPYFAVEDLLQARLTGLQGHAAQDRYAPDFSIDTAPQLNWTGEAFERLYAGGQPLELHTPQRTLRLSSTGFTQWMVWNPGAEGARELADLPDADWQRFVCVEPVIVDRPVALAPGQSFTGTFTIDAVKSAD